jgi:acetyl esterase
MNSTKLSEISEPADVAADPRLSRGTRAFLKILNSPAPPELEKLTPAEARAVLETAQASVEVDLSGIEETPAVLKSN